MLRNGLGLAALGVTGFGLAACSNDSDPISVAAPTTLTLSPLFPLDVPHIVAGRPTRLPFAVTNSAGKIIRPTEGSISFSVAIDKEEFGPAVTAPVRSDGVPYPYLPPTLIFPEPGQYDVVAEVNGNQLRAAVQVYQRSEVGPPQVGDQLPPVDTPTDLRTQQVDPICSRVPACGLHTKSLSAVVGRGIPVAVLLSSPVYCENTTCGPVLDLVVEQVKKFPNIAFFHSEVYRNPKDVRVLSDAIPAPLTDAYDMRFAPSLFIANGAGVLVSRADVVVDRNELSELLNQVG